MIEERTAASPESHTPEPAGRVRAAPTPSLPASGVRGPSQLRRAVGGCGVRGVLPAFHASGSPWGLCRPLGQVAP